MQKRSRQVRRAQERSQQPRAGADPITLIVTVALFVIALFAVIVIKYTQPLPVDRPAIPLSLTPITTGTTYPSGFTLCEPAVEHDPLVNRVRRFVSGFVEWYTTANPVPQVATAEFDRRWKEMIVDLKRLGLVIVVPPHHVVRIAERTAICNYLEPKGWWLGTSSDWVSNDASRPQLWVGRLVARQLGNVERRDKSTEPFRAYIFEAESKLGNIATLATTTGNTVVLFPEAHDQVVADIRDICREVAANPATPLTGMKPYCWAQFRDEYLRLRDTDAFSSTIKEQLVLATFAHEVQHVADQQIQQLDLDTRVSSRTRGQLRGLGEARGMLRQMAWGPLPLLDIGNAVVNMKGKQSVYGLAVILMEDCFNQPLDTVPLDEQRVRFLAVESLNALELQLPDILRFAYEPDMLGALRQSLTENKGR